MAKVLNHLFQSTILESAHLDFHKQSLDLLKLYMLSQIEDSRVVSHLGGALVPSLAFYVSFIQVSSINYYKIPKLENCTITLETHCILGRIIIIFKVFLG
jgi:hypothetical protein